jgi:D-glycero-alpha-D-manno-heptose-7-phosphate kinase
MKRALLLGDAREFGMLLDTAWESKKQMADEITNPVLDEMYSEAKKNGALGGKVSGAGGGGFMVFYCETGCKHKVAERLEQLGGEVVDFKFEPFGLQRWRVETVRPQLDQVVASELDRYTAGEATGSYGTVVQDNGI